MADLPVIAALLATALLHAAWNVALKTGGDRVLDFAAMRMAGIAFGLTAIWFAPMPNPAVWLLLAGAAAAHMVYFACLIGAYDRGDISLVYPIARGMAPVLVAVAAYLAIGEAPAPVALAGIAVISGAILLAGSGAFRDSLPAIALAVTTGAAIATYSFLGGLGVRDAGTVLGFAAWLELAISLPFLAFALATRRRRTLAYARSAAARRSLLLGAGSVLAYFVVLWAMTLLPMATVTATRETSAIFAALAGTLWLREPYAGRRIVAAGLVVLGIGLIAFG